MASGVFSMVGNGIESGLGTYVTQTSAALSSALVPVVTTAVTVWIMAYGFAVMRGEASESVPAFAWRAARLAIMLAIALGSGIYQSTVVTDVQNGTATLAQTIAQAGGGTCSATVSGVTGTSSTSASSIYAALDCYDAQLGAVVTADVNHASQAGLTDFGAAMGYLASAIIVAFGGCIFLLVACLETVLARVFLDLVLGIGPVFIACGAFEPSRRFFDAWTGKVVTYCLMQVLIAAFLGIALAVFSSETASLTGLSSLPAASDSGNLYTTIVNQMMGSASSTSSSVNDDQYFVDALGMLVTGVFLAMLCWQLPSVAAALGGGSAVTGVGAFAAGLASRAVAGATGAVLSQMLTGKGPGSGGSISPGSGGGSLGPGGGARPAYQRAVMDNLNRTSAGRASVA
jgi:type IV secretion system protein VirB6